MSAGNAMFLAREYLPYNAKSRHRLVLGDCLT